MTREEAAKILETDVYEIMPCHASKQDEIIALNMTVDALRAQQPPNTPLTLEELRKMDGESVWVEYRIRGCTPHYAIIYGEKLRGYLPGKERPINLSIDSTGAYGIGRLAYRRKPEEGET